MYVDTVESSKYRSNHEFVEAKTSKKFLDPLLGA